MPTTPNYDLPFPDDTAPVDVPADIRALATATDDALIGVTPRFGTRAERLALTGAPAGLFWSETDAPGNVYAYDGTAWQLQYARAGGLAAGMMFDFAGPAAPVGYLLCDGSAHPRADYPGLFAAIGTTYGGAATTFQVPDLRGRSTLGVGSGDAAGATNHPLGQRAGEETHQLSTYEMPGHDHGGNTGQNFNFWVPIGVQTDRSIALNGTAGYNSGASDGLGESVHTHPIGRDGGDGRHNNMAPYFAATKIIKF